MVEVAEDVADDEMLVVAVVDTVDVAEDDCDDVAVDERVLDAEALWLEVAEEVAVEDAVEDCEDVGEEDWLVVPDVVAEVVMLVVAVEDPELVTVVV